MMVVARYIDGWWRCGREAYIGEWHLHSGNEAGDALAALLAIVMSMYHHHVCICDNIRVL